MRLAICNETFGDQPFAQTCQTARELGYSGLEIAPFTLDMQAAVFDVASIADDQLLQMRQQAAEAELEIIGLHWLLARTEGLYLTSPDAEVRKRTIAYFHRLIDACWQLGGSLLVLGSPQQRNLLPGVTYEQAEDHATEVLAALMTHCSEAGVTIALEPLGPSEGDFLLTAESAIRLAQKVDSPCCRLHLDVKAMASESLPIPQIITSARDWIAHFHANDPNLLGPGMGEVDFAPIIQTLKAIHYDGWVSVEVFRYEPTPIDIARISIDNLRRWGA